MSTFVKYLGYTAAIGAAVITSAAIFAVAYQAVCDPDGEEMSSDEE